MQDVRRLPQIAVPERRTLALSNVLVGVMLVLVMLAGGYFRFVGISWDDFTHLHPDERFLTGVAATLGGSLNPSGSAEDRALRLETCIARYPANAGMGTYFDTYCSALNPLNSLSSTGLYVYGTLPLFIARGAGEVMVQGSEWYAHNVLARTDPRFATYDGSQWTSYDGIHLVWRFLSALSEMSVIVIAFAIGLKLHDKWVGLLAALFYAGAVFSIQMAHFGVVDSIANLFAALSILYAVRVQRDGKLLNYALFGIFFGCAVASRINLAPLATLVAVAGFLQLLPMLDGRVAAAERNRMLLYHGGGLLLSAFLALLCFRIFNPYAFVGPGFFNLSLEERWLSNMGTAQALNAGTVDSPPNFQWVSRIPYIYPLNNMVIWGLGLPLGIIAWLSWLVAGYRTLRGKPGALANVLLVLWVLIYFGWLGHNWVTTMRYFLPLYPVLAVLAAWGLVSLIRRARDRVWLRRVVQVVMLLTAAFTLLWAAMFTNIYRNQLTRVQASEWVWENVPGDFAMRVDDPNQASPLINIALSNNGLGDRRMYDETNLGSEHTFVAPVTGTLNGIYALYLDDPEHDTGKETIYFSVTRVSDNLQLGDALLSDDLTRLSDDTAAQPRAIAFMQPISVVEGETYQLNVLLIDGGPFILGGFSIPVFSEAASETPLINIPLYNNNLGGSSDDLVSRVTRLDQFYPSSSARFTATTSGTITSIHAPHLGDANDDPEAEVLRFTIYRADDMSQMPLATAILEGNLARDDQNILGRSYDIPLDAPLTVEAGEQYVFRVDLVSGGSVLSGGSVFTWEGAWDDPIPTIICALPQGITLADDPPPGLYMDSRDCSKIDPWSGFVNGYTQDIVYEDVPAKRDKVLMTLDNSDYLAISSNRFYDTLSRNPLRWPMTNFYYEKLFAGELGYELVATFQETFELGPLRVSDQYLPTYDGPKWLNELEAEEAFSVYDHPVVFIFKKSADYNAQQVHDLLYSIPLTRANDSTVYMNCLGAQTYYCDSTIVNVATLSSARAALSPTQLQLTEPMRDIQYTNGTWADKFDENSIVNTNQPAAVVIWWFTIVLFGFAAYPLLFVLLPRLPDRGYSFAKFAGMFITGWATWYAATFRFTVWWQGGIAVALGLLFFLGLLLLWRKRDEFVDFIRDHWKRLALIELITLLAFLAMLGVRLTNPDLWQPTYGGEKPMDFAYFNAVLRSTIFPPLDPWYAGGYINYYYVGYVIVGTPVLLLKMFPSIAYNLILPTLFALTGIAAFSVAFALVHTLRERVVVPSSGGMLKRLKPIGSPWVAGIAALLLAVVLGNLDTPRVFLNGVASTGGYSAPAGLEYYLLERYSLENDGRSPDAAGMSQLIATAANPSIVDRLGYELNNSAKLVTSLANGLTQLFRGGGINVSANRWFWAPTRIIQEIPGDGSYAINEMPVFTYIYGDLHAHMISMPMQLAIMGLVLNEVLLAGSKRRRGILALTIALIGLYVGMLRATNTWDWITFMVLGGVGLVFAWWLAQVERHPERSVFARFSRRSLLEFAGYVGGFVAFSFIAVLPFTQWYASSYNTVLPWSGNKTPFWAYLDIHGLFIFLVVSLLIWETARWFRSVYVRSLRGTWLLLLSAVLILAALGLAAVVLSMASYQITLIVLPLLLWVGILFFRKGQSRPMQMLLLLTGLGLGLTLGVEYIVLAGDIGRQNTVFKFYIQAWLILSVVGGAAFAWLINGIQQWKGGLRASWMFALVLLVGVASLFPLMAVRGKAAYRFDSNTCAPTTLDGMDFMNCATQYEGSDQIRAVDPQLTAFTLDEDYAMIRWMQENISGTPIIIEGLSDDTQYHWNGRISIYTGLPTVVGWNWHQRQQRTLEPLGRIVDTRNANVNAFYQTTSIGTAWDMIQFYHIQYVIIGKLERAYYMEQGLAKFDQMVDQGLLEPVFEQGTSTIYRVNPDATMEIRG